MTTQTERFNSEEPPAVAPHIGLRQPDPDRIALESTAPMNLAELFLDTRYRNAGGVATLVTYCGNVWTYDHGYRLRSEDEIPLSITGVPRAVDR